MGNEPEQRPEEEQVSTDETLLQPAANETADGSEEFADDYDENDEEDDPIVIPKLKQAASWLWTRRRISLPIVFAVILLIVMLVPQSRYGLAGLVMRRNFQLVVIDQHTGVAVSEADVTMRGSTVRTDANGIANFESIPVGKTSVEISKAYFEPATQPVTVGFRSADLPPAFALKANGRPVPVNVVNKITGKGVANITVSAAETSAITNERGETTIVLPPDSQTYEAELTGEGYNKLLAAIQVSQQVVAANTFPVTPAGDVYYMDSNRSLYRVRLDGSETSVAIASLTDSLENFQMKQTPDGRFIAFIVHKGGNQQLLILETQTQELLEVETKPGQYLDLMGWTGNKLHYRLTRSEILYWQASRTALKRFDAVERKSFIIDQNRSHGGSENDAVYEEYGGLHLLNGGLFFSKTWIKPDFAEVETSKSDGLYFIRSDSQELDTLHEEEKKSFGTKLNYQTHQTTPVSVIAKYLQDQKNNNFRFEDGLLVTEAVDDKAFSETYPSYLLSPGGLNSVWLNQKKQLVVGDQNGDNGSIIEPHIGFIPYGWVSDNYLVVIRDGDIFAMPSNGLGTLGNRIKLADNIVLSR